ncbi:HTH-type transcriptional repressor KstR2 [compost metagenome]
MPKDKTAASVNRKNEIIAAAIEVFAEIGYFKATTAQVAERAAISQPYVFKFFATKEALLLAALEVSWTRIIDAFRQVIASAASDRLEAELIEAYDQLLLEHKNETLLQMQAQTISDDTIREAMRNGFREVQGMVLEAFQKAGFPNAEDRTTIFLAKGMLCNISMALAMPELKGI